MTVVLVHGVPETAEIWDPLRAELGRDDVVALRLPGFGCPRPDGFPATKEAYVDWLIAQLEGLTVQPGDPIAQSGGPAAQPDGSAARPDGSAGRLVGSAAQPDGSAAQPDGSVAQPGGAAAQAGGSVGMSGGVAARLGGSVSQPGGSAVQPGDSVGRSGGSTAQPGASTAQPGASTAQPEGSVAQPEGSVAQPEGSVAQPEGSVARLVGSAAKADGSVVGSGGAIAQLSGPVDLVGHDWGGGLVLRLVSLRPDLVRTWVTDATALADPAYEWHENAKLFQTPGVGEEILAGLAAATPDQQAAMFTGMGVPADRTAGLTGINATMTGCILALYRSAVEVGAEWGPEFSAIGKPGLALLPTEDGFLPAPNTRSGAAASGADVVELPGRGHWWMLEDPAGAARILTEFWS